jgi:hypothetical protein
MAKTAKRFIKSLMFAGLVIVGILAALATISQLPHATAPVQTTAR